MAEQGIDLLDEGGSETDPLDVMLVRMTDRVAALRTGQDRRRIFLSVYLTMTRAIHAGVAAGRFMDPTWTSILTARFAELYFDAEHAWDEQSPCPGPWKAAFTVAGWRRVSAIEHALLGINAHIVYDLPFAVAAAMVECGDVVDGHLSGDTLARRRHDYEVVNHILAETVTAAQAVLASESRLSRWLDVIALQLDEYAAELLLRASRTQGWHTALALAVARDEQERYAVQQHLDRVACSYVNRIDLTQLVPTRPARAAVGRLRPPFSGMLT